MKAEVLSYALQAQGVPVVSVEDESGEDGGCGWIYLENNHLILIDRERVNLIRREVGDEKPEFLVAVEGFIGTYNLSVVIRDAYFMSINSRQVKVVA